MPRSLQRLLGAVVVVVGTLAVLAAGAVATGQAAFVVTHGVSMNPVYYQGDLVIVARKPSYQVGQIVAYQLPTRHLVVLHRIIGGDASGYVFKGDNNQSIDAAKPPASQLIGRAVLHIPHAGRWLTAAPVALVALVAAGVVLSSNSQARGRRLQRRTHVAGTASSAGQVSAGAALTSLSPPLRAAAAAAATAAVIGLGLGALAWGGPVDTVSTTSTSSAVRSMTFSYSAAVPSSPAYDSRTVTSPDPVVRRLANDVKVHYAYRGVPGNVSVTVELSASSGWHSTVPLSRGPARLDGEGGGGDVSLDLNALDARAEAAAKVTGLSIAQLTMRVVATVGTGSGRGFQPALPLTLSPLVLTGPADPKALTVIDATTAEASGRMSRTLKLGRYSLSAATARNVSASLLSLVLVGAGLLCILAGRTLPGSEGASIRRRYSPMLVPVEPVSTPPGRPIVDVPEFAALARLAQRYGPLVLHWTRSDVETFIVQDDATTYRYRTGAVETPPEAAPTSLDALPVPRSSADEPGPAGASVAERGAVKGGAGGED